MPSQKPAVNFGAVAAEMLPLLRSGSLTVTVNNYPLLKADAESKSVEIEIKGAKETGLDIQTLMKAGSGGHGILETLKSSESMAKELHEKGWKLSIYDSGSTLITMGRDVSGLTGYIWANPLKLLKVFSTL